MENNEKNGSTFEFSFESATSNSGLVFEVEKPKVSVEEQKSDVNESASKSDTPEKNEPREAQILEEKPQNDEEFGVPETFRVDEKYNTPLRENERTRIYTTYVPRFTGISDTYRMKDDPRPRPKTEEQTVSVKAERAVETVVKAEEVKEPAVVEKIIAKEPAQEAEGTVVINVSEPMPESSEEDAINIFKFPEEELSDADRMNIEEENANRKALEELKARQAERRARAEAERLAELEEQRRVEEISANIKLSPEDYEIPDPERIGFVGRGDVSSKDSDYDTPHGIPSDNEKTRKLKLSEYTSAGQRDSFKDKFLDSLVAIRIRIIALILIGVLAVVLENAELFNLKIDEMLKITDKPSAIGIIDFQLVLIAFLLVIPETVRALKALFGKIILPELSLTVSFAVYLLYIAITTLFNFDIGYPIFGFVFIVPALFAVLSSYLRKKTEFESFKFISVKGEKRIIEHEETRKYARTMLALDGAIDGYKSNTAKTFRTTFVSDFFAHSRETSVNSKNNLIMILVGVGVAIVTALVSFFVAESNPLYHAMAAFALVTVFSLPSVAYISHSLSYYHAGKEVASESSALVGERAYTETAGVDVISFEDTEIFGEEDVNLKRFGFYGNEDNMNKCMRLITSLFASVGGPLHTIFAKTLEKRCTPATDPFIEEDGVSGNVDGKIVAAGTAEYMQRHGIKIPEDNERTYSGIGSESMKIMYGAESGVVFAKFYIRYSFSEEFTSLLPALREEHIVPLVYTCDPNISNDLFKTLTMGGDCMRVMRRKVPRSQTEKVYPRISSAVITTGDKVNAIRLVLIARKYKRFQRKLATAEIISMAAGTTLAALLCAFGFVFEFPELLTVIFGSVQLVSGGIFWLFSKKKFSISKNKGK